MQGSGRSGSWIQRVVTDRSVASAYSPQLDGLRAVAVATVAWSHWLPQWQLGLPLGAGVHLFFVLSGFLITRILLGLRAVPDRGAAIGRFYVRRALRLFPAFYLVLGVAAWADVPLVRDTWAWHASYLSNLFIAADGQWQGHVSHFWSLAVEEQFYLVWPWLVVFAPARWLAPALAGTIVLGPLARLIAARDLPEPFWALVPAGSADSLGLGAWLAWAAWPARRAPAWLVHPLTAGAAVGLWAALAVAGPSLPSTVAIWRQALQGVVFAWIVWRAVAGFTGPAGRLLAHPVLAGVGRISYGVYLIHAFAPVATHAAARAAGVALPAAAGARAMCYAAVTLILAGAMWRLVERPLLAWKARVPYAGAAVACGAAAVATAPAAPAAASPIPAHDHGQRTPASARPI
jgi:peptidoglycan/LPS O-acetylase OafA/YrhL